ncbi:putative Prolamin-like domain-containing protein [Arabidopsis thaliana]
MFVILYEYSRVYRRVSQSILTGKFGNIGPACCKAILEAQTNCIPQLPFNPFFPPLLKEQCSKTVGAIPLMKK